MNLNVLIRVKVTIATQDFCTNLKRSWDHWFLASYLHPQIIWKSLKKKKKESFRQRVFPLFSGLKFNDPGVMIKVSLRKLTFDVLQIISLVTYKRKLLVILYLITSEMRLQFKSQIAYLYRVINILIFCFHSPVCFGFGLSQDYHH